MPHSRDTTNAVVVTNGNSHQTKPYLDSQPSPPKRLNVGVVGIGRMGKQHALNAVHRVSQTNLVCICDVLAENLKWATEELAPYGVQIYRDITDMLQQSDLEAVIIASPTHLHQTQVIDCIQHGLHVLCEKPLAMTVEQAKEVLAIAKQKSRSHLKVMTAFCRRFDKSYQNAVRAIKAGKIGSPVVIRAENRDQFGDSEFHKNYLLQSPGIFIDSCIHDIDLTINFLSAASSVLPRPRSCSAIGTIALHQELQQTGDVDSGIGIVEWYSPTPSSPAPISYYHVSRIQRHGFDNPTEISGTNGILKINLHPHRDLIQFASSDGISNEVGDDFYDRYEHAFVNELETFANAVLLDKALPFDLESSLRGMEIAEALQEALRTGNKITWDEHGCRKDRCGVQNGFDPGFAATDSTISDV